MLEVATATSSWVCILASSLDSMWRTMEDFNTITSSEILCDLSYLDERSLPGIAWRTNMTLPSDRAMQCPPCAIAVISTSTLSPTFKLASIPARITGGKA